MTQFASTLYPQTNPTNPILLDLREHYRGDWGVMLKHFNYVTYAAGHYVTKDWERITEGRQIDHARRVLTRLASLS